MKKLFKILHIISITVFFGSIATYILFGELITPNDTQAWELNRLLVAKGTLYLTLPAMWIAGISGLLMSGRPKTRWLWLKLGGFLVAAINTHVFVYPAIMTSLGAVNNNETLFQSAMLDEAVFGAVNVVLIITLVVVAVVKPKLGTKT